MKILRNIYKVARSLLFSVISFVAVVYLILYILLSVPAIQNDIKKLAEKEASKFLGGEVRIENLILRPFNELVLCGVDVFTPGHDHCVRVETVGAGINLTKLIKGGGIEFSYGEIIGLDAKISQEYPDSPLNIQFIIDAFKPKDKNKPPTKFDINLRNVVLRRCGMTFDKLWQPVDSLIDKTDFNHFRVYDLKADVTFPQLKNDDFMIDLRRLSFKVSGGLVVDKMAFRTHITPKSISIADFVLQLPSSEIRPSDMTLRFDGFPNIRRALEDKDNQIILVDNKVSLSDFGWIIPEFRKYPQPFDLSLDLCGSLSDLTLNNFSLKNRNDIDLSINGKFEHIDDLKKSSFSLDNINFKISNYGLTEVKSWIPSLSAEWSEIISNIEQFELSATGSGDIEAGIYEMDCHLFTGCGDLYLIGNSKGLKTGEGIFYTEITTDSFNVGKLLGKGKVGNVNLSASAGGEVKGKDFDGEVDLYVSEIEFDGKKLEGIIASVIKNGKDYDGNINVDNDVASFEVSSTLHWDKGDSWVNIETDIDYFYPSYIGLLSNYDGYCLEGRLNAELEGSSVDDAVGDIRLTDLKFLSKSNDGISLDHLIIKSQEEDEGSRHLFLTSDWVDGEISGIFKMADIKDELISMASSVFPSLVAEKRSDLKFRSDLDFSLLVKADNTLTEFFNLPFRILVPIPIEGMVNGTENRASLAVDIPYLQQGKNKLLRDNRLIVDLDGIKKTVNLDAATTFPVKRGELALNVNLFGQEDKIFADIDWVNTENNNFKGFLSLGASLSKSELTSKPEIMLDINPSIFNMGAAKWNIDKGRISYADDVVDVEGIKIWHDGQFVEIDGRASALPTDTVSIRLASIDLDYVFETLNINYVTFGGLATGDITASGAFSKEPVALTDNLSVKKFSYNGSLLGDAEIKSKWDNEEKEVKIYADIMEGEKRRAVIDGGIWVTRDSLSFGIDADRVPIGFLAPFMGAFSSDVKGYASGNAKLFGTFSDIDLTGRILGDSISLKLDYTNTYYHGTDSVILNPGRIVIPSFRLYDRAGNSALLTGELKHRYFHDPSFTFRISDAKGLLCYDTNQKMNPDWYGTIYGNGGAVVRGWPGTVSVSVDMAVADNSTFTFVLNDTEAAADYHFLTFTDRRKEALEKLAADSVPDMLAAFRKKVEKGNDVPTRFLMDIRCSVTPTAVMTLVMDPVAGDKITARGNGALQLDYESDSDDIQMLGKYTLTEGYYNFSLQDLILRNFTILPGSSISFNGDPLNANLDITASYRVNTNLSDLDKSFSTDPELARTNVPVDALLMVKGDMQQPDITFDIDLPTLTQDVERKVKSIISTDDMMSRQIIYLLALNRFYTPEFMGSSSNGGELAAVASTTLSSQLSNMIGQLTDKFTLAPSFRSDKGDFSDLEVDVALSSRLLNNRLLVNGNFGYRDKSTSTTTFVGDFDIEYLLSRSGNLRLKAYNHFNDQNYYLREALTTQGLGVVYRRDFDNPFTFLKKHNKQDDRDTLPANNRQLIAHPSDSLKRINSDSIPGIGSNKDDD